MDELRQRLTEELDYEHEASNQRLFYDHYQGHPNIAVPEVYDDLSSARVLTTELAAGATFEEVLGWPQDQRDRVAETIYRFSFGSIYRLWAFNGDPHPGNYLFHPDGSVIFLDFGLVKRFTLEETAQFERMLTAMVIDRDIPRFRAEQVAAGLLPADAPFSDDEVESFFTHFYEFVLTDETRTFTPEYAAAGVRAIFNASGEHAELKKVLNVPPSLVVLQRINLGLIFAVRPAGGHRQLAEHRRRAMAVHRSAPVHPHGPRRPSLALVPSAVAGKSPRGCWPTLLL